jgi:RNA polymerase sigma factor (sigma-70 family)
MMTIEAFKTDVLPIKDKLYRAALRITVNPAEAEDVVQEVFIKVWEQRERLAEIHNLEAWCMQLTKNRAIDKRRLRCNHETDLEHAYGLSSNGRSPAELAELDDAMNQVGQAMSALPPAQRAAMQLRDIEGLSYQEIAEELGMPLPQVKTNIFRARQAVRAKLMQLWATN